MKLLLGLTGSLLLLASCADRTSADASNRVSAPDTFLDALQFPAGAEVIDEPLPPGDDSDVRVIPFDGEAMPVGPGDAFTIVVQWEGQGVTGVNVGFGGDQHVHVPIEDSGSQRAMIPVSVAPDVCDDLYDICHQIACYEQVTTAEGTMSKEEAQQMVLDCTDGEGCGGAPPPPPPNPNPDPDPDPPSDECVASCPDGKICLYGECVDRNPNTSCELREPSCCPGQDDGCTGATAACYCDEFCVQAGDCCTDACSVCGFC